ncbi:MAG TPA: aminotransferase class I/II-fold pyridoxal phosphate-dependent enzyme [candidate division Zixibacteria bacterium]|nr:aminotransferase class I/II-fold pyridoxal phosphate-dependent enzyme [candidate division Zixibacteria bacterium]
MSKASGKIIQASRVQDLKYAIRDISAEARKMAAQGKDLIWLNIGDPNKFDFETPQNIVDAFVKAARENKSFYSESQGILPLREAIVEKETKINGAKNLTVDDVHVTAGISEGIMFLFGSLLNQGDEVLIPGPAYPSYTAFPKFYEAQAVTYRTISDDNWQPDEEDIRKKVTDKTKAILVINPNNPTGAVYREKELKNIVDIAGEFNIPIIADEIYDRLTMDQKFIGMPSVSKDVPLFMMNGFSKVYLMPGWRVGYCYLQDPDDKIRDVYEGIIKLGRLRLCVNTPAQYGCIEALTGPQDHIKETVAKLRSRRDLIYKRLNEIDGISTEKPEAAFYIFPKIENLGKYKTDKEFILSLLREEGVVGVFGSGFDPIYGNNHFRLVFLSPDKIIEDAMHRLENFMKRIEK